MDAEQLKEIRDFRTNYENGKNVSSYDVINFLDVLFPALLDEVERLTAENERMDIGTEILNSKLEYAAGVANEYLAEIEKLRAALEEIHVMAGNLVTVDCNCDVCLGLRDIVCICMMNREALGE